MNLLSIISVLALIFGVICFVWSMKTPEVIVHYAISMIPIQTDAILIPGLRVNEYAIVLFFIRFLLSFIKNKRFAFISKYRFFFIWLFYLIITTLINLMIYNNNDSVVELLRVVIAFIFPITLVYFSSEDKLIKDKILLTWMFSGAFCSIFAICNVICSGQSIVRYLSAFTLSTKDFYNNKFLASPFYSDPNNFAGYLIISMGITFYFSLRYKKALYWFFLVVEFISFFFCLSRGGYIAFVGALCILLLINRRTKVLGALGIICGFIAAVLLVIPYIQGDQSALSRFELWKTALNMFKARPLTGVGLGNFTYLFSRFKTSEAWNNPYTHNIYIKVLTEQGLIGECIFLYCCIDTLKESIKQYKKGYVLFIVFIFGLLSFLIQGLTVEFFSSYYFWVLLAMAVKENSSAKEIGDTI